MGEDHWQIESGSFCGAGAFGMIDDEGM